MWEELSFKNSVEQGCFLMHETPNLFRKKSIIELTKISEAETPYLFWLTQLVPTHPMYLPLVRAITPPKFTNHGLQVMVEF